ncbi:hypothetical protein F7D01_14300 [Erythrobacter sp. 3-20A1M]|nr:hypothetical protein F7D01_14300 [Erythrobacter sp. 3-20A1M]
MAATEASAFDGELEPEAESATTTRDPEQWYSDVEDEGELPRPHGWLAPAVASTAILAWTAFFLWSHYPAMRDGAAPAAWSDWIVSWAVPCVLVISVWLLVMRNSRREASRFADVAHALSRESEMLEARLSTVNRELSLAREFLSAQSRDLESLGRVAGENLSRHAERLQELIVDNGEQVDRLAGVSAKSVENMEHLRSDLPVVASAARDVANQIGQAGDGADRQLERLVSGFAKLEGQGANSERRVAALQDRIDAALAAFETQIDNLEGRVAAHFAALRQRSEEQGRVLQEGASAFEEDLGARENRLAEAHREMLHEVETRTTALDGDLTRFRELLTETSARMTRDGESASRWMADLAEQLQNARESGESASSALAEHGRTLLRTLGDSNERVGETREVVAGLTDECVRLLELIQAAGEHSREALPQPIADAENRLKRLHELGGEIEKLLTANVSHAGELADHMESAHKDGETMLGHADGVAQRIDSLRSDIAALGADSRETVDAVDDRLSQVVAGLEEKLSPAIAAAGERGHERIVQLAERLSRESGDTLRNSLERDARSAIDALADASHSAGSQARDAADALMEQLAEVERLTANLEARVEQARARAQDQVDADFGRRAAMIAESLNSNAIDIARSLSADVSDTAWTRYLRGDRGVFTRRAVTLLEPVEAREIAELYDSDGEFRDHVARFIHDFEAMLRTMLSVRDGNALAVTLLGSDMGKLYVALAQAIERLRDA